MTSSDRIYDVIIVGSGVEGSATGYYLTSRHTKNVVLLEQVICLQKKKKKKLLLNVSRVLVKKVTFLSAFISR